MDYQLLAAQLRKPAGEFGRKVGENMNVSNRLMNLETIRLLSIAPGDRVLEIGTGNGYFGKNVIEAAERVWYTGCDFSPDMVAEATQLNQPWVDTGKANFVLADANALPFGNNSFDKIFTVNTLYFWENPEAVLREAGRVLKPDGKLVLGLRPREIMLTLPFVQYGFTLYTGPEAANLVANSGFSVVSAAEITEPDYEINGTSLPMAFVLVLAGKKEN